MIPLHTLPLVKRLLKRSNYNRKLLCSAQGVYFIRSSTFEHDVPKLNVAITCTYIDSK